MVTGRGYPYERPHPLTIYMDFRKDIRAKNVRADVRVELSVLRTVRQGL